MEFITVEHPAQTGSAALKRQAHSHAARVAHARLRKIRVANYMQQRVGTEDHQGSGEKGQIVGGNDLADSRQKDEQVIAREIKPPSPSLTTVSGVFEHEALASFLKSLTTREHFLFSHYVREVFPYLVARCPIVQQFSDYSEYIVNNWLLFSSADLDLLRGFLLASCRHLSLVHMEPEYEELAIQYKLSYLRGFRESKSTNTRAMGCMAVTRAVVLAFDDFMIGDLLLAANHISKALQIVQEAGGFEALGLSKLVQYTLHSCIYAKRLLDLDPVLRQSAMDSEQAPMEV